MKKTKKLLPLLLASVLIFTLCAVSGAAPASAEGADAAGEYSFLCARFSAAYLESTLKTGREPVPNVRDRYIDAPQYAGYKITLNADGTGYLFFGEDNQGSIDTWSTDGETLRFQAGVSEFEGTIADGLMTLGITDGCSLCFVLPGTETADVKPISPEAFADLAYGIVEGDYTLFAAGFAGQIQESSELGTGSVLTLEKGGKGSLSFDEESMEITAWTLEGDTISLALADGSTATGELLKEYGVIELDAGYVYYYGQAGADQDAVLRPDTKLFALYDSIDAKAGAHLQYSVHTDYMDSTSRFDVHVRDGVYYSSRTTEVSGYEDTKVTFFRDGTAYLLDPAQMTLSVATTTASSLVRDNVLMMDQLYSAIFSHARGTDFTEETRELDGVTCQVYVYPATDYQAEASFWFDEEGNLVRYEEGAPVIETTIELGESVYTVGGIDTAVDESLFDISGYQPAE